MFDWLSRLSRWRSHGIAGLLMLGAVGLAIGWYANAHWFRTRARRAWLVREETEIRRQLQAGRPNPTRPGAGNWLSDNFILFENGWAAYRLHSFHSDPDGGDSWSGLGDITVLIDGQGQATYSRFHFCDGTLGWALGYPLQPLGGRPANREAFLALFPPGTWTDDRAAVETAIAAGKRPR
jgi:hypothetical protein